MLGIVIALFIRHVPLRGFTGGSGTDADKAPVATAADPVTG